MIRAVEAAISALLIVGVLSASYYLYTPDAVLMTGRKVDMEKTAYSVINSLVKEGSFETILFEKNGNLRQSPFWEQELKAVIGSLLAPQTFYNLTIYKSVRDGDWIRLEPINKIWISNAIPADYQELTRLQVSGAADVVYTSRSLDVFQIHFVIIRGFAGA